MCRFHLTRTEDDHWLIRSNSFEAFPPNLTHCATAERWTDGVLIRKIVYWANDQETAEWGVFELLHRYHKGVSVDELQ